MRTSVAVWAVGLLCSVAATPVIVKRDAQFTAGEPIDANGKGGPILGT